MAKTPFFSIIIPTLNEQKYLPHLLQDLVVQTFTDFETIIVDALSTDNTLPKAKSFTDLTLKIITSKQRNVSFQRNLGASKAQGNWIIFFDADNRLPKNFLKTIKDQLDAGGIDAFTTHICPDTDNPGDRAIARVSNLGITLSNLAKNPTAFGAVIGINKSHFTHIGGFDKNISFQEDVDFVRRVVKAGLVFKVLSHPKITYSFRRFRKEGTLNLIRKFAKLNLNSFTRRPLLSHQDYPMLGGSYYDSISKQPLVFNFTKLEHNLKRLTVKQKIKFKQFLDTFLAE